MVGNGNPVQILALSDEIVSFIHSPVVKKRFHHVGLLVGCGDLPIHYLEYVLTVLDVPLVYVPGNHDLDRYEIPGGIGIDGKIKKINGLNVLGLGGSRRYKKEGRHQYTESQMRLRVIKQILSAILRPGVLRSGLDLFISHAPPRGVHDSEDFAHQGFSSFHLLLSWLRPKMMLHGHTHTIQNLDKSETVVQSTRVINIYPYKLVTMD